MISTLDFPKLVFIHGKADVSKWFGERAEYNLLATDAVRIYHVWGAFEERTVTKAMGIGTKVEVAQRDFEARLKVLMNVGDALEAVARGCQVRSPRQDKVFQVMEYNGEKLLMSLSTHSVYHGVTDIGGFCGWYRAGFSVEDILAEDYHFYFPPKAVTLDN